MCYRDSAEYSVLLLKFERQYKAIRHSRCEKWVALQYTGQFIGIHMIACHHVLQLHTCPYTVVNLLACCPNTGQYDPLLTLLNTQAFARKKVYMHIPFKSILRLYVCSLPNNSQCVPLGNRQATIAASQVSCH
jgi:hypothetical protein